MSPALRKAAAFAARGVCHRARSTLAIAQPTAGTHPHLVGPGEVTPGVTRAEYTQRRAVLAATLPVGSVAIFPSAPRAYISHDVLHTYAQSPDLHYLCGFLEPNCLLACSKPWVGSAGALDGDATWHLFVEPTDPAQALWDGPRAGVAGARQHILSDGQVHPIRTAPRVLRDMVDAAVAGAAPSASVGGPLGANRSLACLLFDSAVNPTITKSLSPLLEASAQKLQVMRASPFVERLRLRKSASEISLMRHAAQAAAEAFVVTMEESAAAAARGDQLEGLLAARFEFETKRRGCGRLAYPCVVASGANAVFLHYMHNNARLTPGDLVLMDAGGSYFGYSADITRTWPLSGSFTPAQRDIYEAVLGVNEAVIRAVRADGATSLQSLHQLSIRLMHEALVSLGILKPAELQRVSRYYPHAIGHYLGLDVHDTPNASQSQARVPAYRSRQHLRAHQDSDRDAERVPWPAVNGVPRCLLNLPHPALSPLAHSRWCRGWSSLSSPASTSPPMMTASPRGAVASACASRMMSWWMSRAAPLFSPAAPPRASPLLRTPCGQGCEAVVGAAPAHGCRYGACATCRTLYSMCHCMITWPVICDAFISSACDAYAYIWKARGL